MFFCISCMWRSVDAVWRSLDVVECAECACCVAEFVLCGGVCVLCGHALRQLNADSRRGGYKLCVPAFYHCSPLHVRDLSSRCGWSGSREVTHHCFF